MPKAIGSCRGTACSHEIIVVDDGSSDGTSAWLAAQPDLIAIRTENWGKDWAVNTGFARARGQYVRFLDSDDWLEPGANDAQIAIARETGADIVLGDYRTFDDRAKDEASWLRAQRVSLVVGDIPPLAFAAAARAGWNDGSTIS